MPGEPRAIPVRDPHGSARRKEPCIGHGPRDEAGREHGLWTWITASGRSVRQTQYAHGLREGPHGEWHDNGQKHIEGSYRADRRTGPWLTWHANGIKAAEETYADGLRDGECLSWDEQGRLQQKSCWQAGKQHGPMLRWRDNGLMATAGWYDRGRKHGRWIEFGLDGPPRTECHYRHNRLDGLWRAWHPNGQLWIEAHYARGSLHGPYAQWRPDGRLRSRLHFVGDVPLGRGWQRFQDPQEINTPGRAKYLFWFALLGALGLAIYKEPALGVGLLVLLLTILIHEFGHLAAAKAVGIPIRRFRVAAGPALVRVMLGNSRYELGMLPVWGFVQSYEMRAAELAYYYSAERAYRRGEPLPPESPRLRVGKKKHTSDLVSRPRRLFFYLGGILCNLATAGALLLGHVLLPAGPPSQPDRLVARAADLRAEKADLDRREGQAHRQMWRQTHQEIKLARAEKELARDRELDDEQRQLRWQKLKEDRQRLDEEKGHSCLELGQVRGAQDRLNERKAAFEQERDAYLRQKEGPSGDLEAIGKDVLARGWRGALVPLAVVNLLIAVINLLPLPPLDGSRCLLVTVEMALRRDLSGRLQGTLNVVGCLCLLVFLGSSVYFMVREIVDVLLR